jgi:hypothetical protein
MWPTPDDAALVRRMRVAHHDACTALHAGHAPNWLRLSSAPTSQLLDTYWNGAIDAEQHLPASIPRPRLRRWHDWTDPTYSYRGELYDYVSTDTIATRAAITTPVDVPATWWPAVRAALDTIATTATTRRTIEPGFLAWAMPHYLGTPASEPGCPLWTTAHGDFHFANLCAPGLTILDWEGWGLAPAGYDAATLHSYSLLTPQATRQIRTQLAHLLDTSAGRYAELAVITELLYAADHNINQALRPALRRRAAAILNRH